MARSTSPALRARASVLPNLRAFFKAQMPDPWPSAEAPPPRRVAPPPAARPSKQWPLMRSRLALAASVALLVGALLFVAQAFQGRPTLSGGSLPIRGASADSQNDPIHHPTLPNVTIPSDAGTPSNLKINLIQEPGKGVRTIQVDVWPLPPK